MEQTSVIQTESRRKRFKWDNIRRIFHRSSSKGPPQAEGQRSRLLSVFTPSRSRSTSELQATSTMAPMATMTSAPQPIPTSTSLSGGGGGVTNAVGAVGLSVSQDSVFAFDDSPGGSNYQQKQLKATPVVDNNLLSSLQLMSELHAAIGRRQHRSTEEDEGLPRSPITLRHPIGSVPISTATSRCVDSSINSPVYGSGGGSDPSLISINSCELEEASCDSLHSRNPSSSKVIQTTDATVQGLEIDEDSLGLAMTSSASAVPLSHNAALHKRAIRPRKSHAPARHRQLPQLASGSVGRGTEFDIEMTIAMTTSATPLAPERKNRVAARQLDLLGPPLPSSPSKHRSLSLGRANDSVIVAQQNPEDGAIGAAPGPSTAKVARSKSSVEKKLQHEVAGFWRRTKEVNRLFKSSQSRDRSQDNRSTEEGEQQAAALPPPTGKRKDLRKIKRDKEEKRKKNNENGRSESPSPPAAAFLSRFFGSRRSGRNRNNNDNSKVTNKTSAAAVVVVSTTPEPVINLTVQSTPPPPPPSLLSPPVPMPRNVFIRPDHEEDGAAEELEVNWNIAPPSSSVTRTSVVSPSSDAVSPKLNRKTTTTTEVSPLPGRHHRIHIAGLSPYQRRVQRIGNGLEVTDDDDDDWDSPTDASYHFRADHQQQRGGANNRLFVARPLLQPQSLDVNINQDFILSKRASPPTPSENIRRSLEVLKFSNQGLKKTIDSLNQQQQQQLKRMSQSSDQLQQQQLSVEKEKGGGDSSAGSMSNSTSSLNISDVVDENDVIDTGMSSSMASLSHSIDQELELEKDVHDDVLIVDDHREKNEQYRWSPVVTSPVQDRQMAAVQQPMFSMSVRVQNPPDVIHKFKRSLSSPNEQQQQPASLFGEIGGGKSRGASINVVCSQQSPLRPWQCSSKEDKDRQNKWALLTPDSTDVVIEDESIKATPSLLMLMDMDIPADVKLRPKKLPGAIATAAEPQQQQQQQDSDSELLKVFARRSLKTTRDSQEILVDVVTATALGYESRTNPEPEVIQKGSTAGSSPGKQQEKKILLPSPPPPDSPKKKKPIPKLPSPSTAPVVKASERGSYSLTSPMTVPFSPANNNNNNNNNNNTQQQQSQPEDIWKRLSQTKNYQQRPPPHFINTKLAVKSSSSGSSSSNDEEGKPSSTLTSAITTTTTSAAAASASGRQSKVLAMVHNIQRLQVT